MAKKLKLLTKETIKMVKTSALAQKHNCSDVYVRCVLNGTRKAKTELAKLILRDANDIVAIYERSTSRQIESKG